MRRRQILALAGKPRPAQPSEKTPAEQYEERFGKKPHHRMKPETIRKALEDGKSG